MDVTLTEDEFDMILSWVSNLEENLSMSGIPLQPTNINAMQIALLQIKQRHLLALCRDGQDALANSVRSN